MSLSWLLLGGVLWRQQRSRKFRKLSPLPPIAERQNEFTRQLELVSRGELPTDQKAIFVGLVFQKLRSKLAPHAARMSEARKILNAHTEASAVLQALDKWLAASSAAGLGEETLEEIYRLIT